MPRIRLLQKRGIILIIFFLSFLTYWVINKNLFVNTSWSRPSLKPTEPIIDHGHVFLKNDIAARRIRSILEREFSQNRNSSWFKSAELEKTRSDAARKSLPLCPDVPPVCEYQKLLLFSLPACLVV